MDIVKREESQGLFENLINDLFSLEQYEVRKPVKSAQKAALRRIQFVWWDK